MVMLICDFVLIKKRDLLSWALKNGNSIYFSEILSKKFHWRQYTWNSWKWNVTLRTKIVTGCYFQVFLINFFYLLHIPSTIQMFHCKSGFILFFLDSTLFHPKFCQHKYSLPWLTAELLSEAYNNSTMRSRMLKSYRPCKTFGAKSSFATNTTVRYDHPHGSL